MLNSVWQQYAPATLRMESHYGDRVFPCFPERPANLDAVLRETAQRHGEREALVYQQQRVSYRQLNQYADALAAHLQSAGLQQGDRVAVYLGNSIALFAAYFGALRAGLVVVPIGIRQQAPELEFIINNCSAAALIFDADSFARLPARNLLPTVKHYYSANGASAGTESFDDLLQRRVTPPPILAIGEEDTAFIVYTSGTTGRPKGAMVSHLGVLHTVRHTVLSLGYTCETRIVMVLPGTHIAALAVIVMTMAQVGASITVVRDFNTRELLQIMRDEKITATLFVPTIYTRLLLEPDFDSYNLATHWRTAHYGAAPMPETTVERLRAHVPELRLHHGYGATETSGIATLLPPDQLGAHPDSVGAGQHCIDIRVMDEHGVELPAGEAGELWIGGPGIAKGYWGNPEESKRAFVGGYWRSGDMGSKDKDGFVRILDRQKDMIIRGGFKVYSVEVENVLATMEGIVEAAVVPTPCPVLGERVHAFIYANAPLTTEAIRTYCKERLADYKVPDFVTLEADPLPRNPTGKLLKAPLRDRARELAAK